MPLHVPYMHLTLGDGHLSEAQTFYSRHLVIVRLPASLSRQMLKGIYVVNVTNALPSYS